GWTGHKEAGNLQGIGDPNCQRILRANYHQVNLVLAGSVHDPRNIHGIDIDQFGVFGNARVSGSAKERINHCTLRELPADSMLTCAPAHYQYSMAHVAARFPCESYFARHLCGDTRILSCGSGLYRQLSVATSPALSLLKGYRNVVRAFSRGYTRFPVPQQECRGRCKWCHGWCEHLAG